MRVLTLVTEMLNWDALCVSAHMRDAWVQHNQLYFSDTRFHQIHRGEGVRSRWPKRVASHPLVNPPFGSLPWADRMTDACQIGTMCIPWWRRPFPVALSCHNNIWKPSNQHQHTGAPNAATATTAITHDATLCNSQTNTFSQVKIYIQSKWNSFEWSPKSSMQQWSSSVLPNMNICLSLGIA